MFFSLPWLSAALLSPQTSLLYSMRKGTLSDSILHFLRQVNRMFLNVEALTSNNKMSNFK